MRSLLVGLVLALLAPLLLAPVVAAAGSQARGAPGLPGTHTQPRLGSRSQSYNWCGCDVNGGSYSTVTATWVQPRVKNAGAVFTATAIWVGLDGDGSETVEQIGTEAYSQGVVGYSAWYEMYPDYPVPINMAIRPGDAITATVTWIKPCIFRLRLDNATSGATFSTDQIVSIPPALASAEVIAESPVTTMGDVVHLADYTEIQFTDCRVDGQPLGSYDWTAIDMVDTNGDRLAIPSEPDSTGTAFSISTDVTAPRTTVEGADRWSNQPVELRFSATDGGSSGVARTEYSSDAGVTWTEGTALTIDAPADHSGDGEHEVLFRSADKAGNVEETRTCRVGIDTQRPAPGVGTPAVVRRGKMATLRYTVTDGGGSPTATVRIVVRDRRGAVVQRATRRARIGVLSAYRFRCDLRRGVYRAIIWATDSAGNRQAAVASARLEVR